MDEPFTPQFFRRLQQLKIRTRRTYLGSRQGTHTSLRHGHGLEFSDYRQYTPGDDFRYIDWGVYGRTDRVYVRQFREEQDLGVMVILDSSASMGFPENEGKFEMARHLALSLGYIALTEGDAVTFSLLGQHNTPRYTGPRALHRAIRALNAITPKGSIDIINEIRAAIARHKIPGKCFFISDFLFSTDEQISVLDMLWGRNYDLTVIQVLSPSELRLDVENLQHVVDAETGDEINLALDTSSRQEYASLLASHIESLERYCVKRGIVHLLVSSNELLNDVLLKRLPARGVIT